MKNKIMEVRGLTKSFPGVKAIDNIDFDLYEGEVLGICGENGAGKSTLIKCLSGVHQADNGIIKFMGKEVVIKNERKALDLGISVIYQELSVVPEMDIAQNVFLGNLPTNSLKLIDYKKLHRNTIDIMMKIGLTYDTKTLVNKISISEKQMVEIGKAISHNAKVLIMDEPTSSLGIDDTNRLFDLIKKFKEQNYGIIFISHHMDEIFKITDRVLVLRDGKSVQVKKTKDWDIESLVYAMVDRELSNQYPKKSINCISQGEPALKIEGLTNKYINNVSFNVRKGEIVGLAGIVGAGRSEVLKSIYGAYKVNKGNIFIQGNKINVKSPQHAMKAGIAFMSEDRKNDSLCLWDSVKKNVILPYLKVISRFSFVSNKKMKRIAMDSVQKYKIKTTSIERPVIQLSGGNQQKILFARITYMKPDVYLLDEPTRGIDVSIKEDIYKEIIHMAENGSAVVLVTSELQEIIGLADRVFVMYGRSIVAELQKNEINQEKIMHYATGGNAI